MHRLAAVLLLVLALGLPAFAADLRYANPVVAGVRTHLVVVDLKSPTIRVQPMVSGKPPLYMKRRARTFASMVKGTGCLAAINGTFFDPRTYTTLGSMVFDGRLVHEGFVGSLLLVDRAGRGHYVKRGADLAGMDLSPYTFGVASGPTLVHRGRIALNPRAEGFRDPRLFSRAKRSAVGIRGNGELILVVVSRPVYLSQLARMMRKLGAEYALNLDGGSSSGMYYRGKWLARPKRKITNILAVLKSDDVGVVTRR
ncbi:MAG: phosphodiester glycosidase family protein [Armatimonadetes bacterium]|nr:phosphodiester glycosidase family protein [Armatimonadota bacterium]